MKRRKAKKKGSPNPDALCMKEGDVQWVFQNSGSQYNLERWTHDRCVVYGPEVKGHLLWSFRGRSLCLAYWSAVTSMVEEGQDMDGHSEIWADEMVSNSLPALNRAVQRAFILEKDPSILKEIQEVLEGITVYPHHKKKESVNDQKDLCRVAD